MSRTYIYHVNISHLLIIAFLQMNQNQTQQNTARVGTVAGWKHQRNLFVVFQGSRVQVRLCPHPLFLLTQSRLIFYSATANLDLFVFYCANIFLVDCWLGCIFVLGCCHTWPYLRVSAKLKIWQVVLHFIYLGRNKFAHQK